MTHLSFVIPCYRSAETLPAVVAELNETLQTERFAGKYTHEIILVCDGSPDNTYEVIQEMASRDAQIRGINFARNFGQHAALMAGIRASKGDIVICLDDDGQSPANQCDRLIDKIEEGYDACYASYAHKKHSGVRNAGSRLNERMTRIMLGKPKELYISSYFAVRRFVAEEMANYTNAYPYVLGLVLRTTKNIANAPVDHRERAAGTTGYTFKKLLGLWFNGFTNFSVKPLRIATFCGGFFAIVGFLYALWTVVKHLFIDNSQPMGWTMMMSVLLFIGGILMLMLGLIGEYIGRIYVSMNAAPQYVIRETTGEEKSGEL
ncbi:MAG: glycosyltransferase family 2 protein [Lachnospiraceae bacterium]|nr:glycosyltransferase family 2 protein [Lachnospiraceae bacterium]